MRHIVLVLFILIGIGMSGTARATDVRSSINPIVACQTTEQVERFLSVWQSSDTSAVGQVNAEAKQPVCLNAPLKFVQGSVVENFRWHDFLCIVHEITPIEIFDMKERKWLKVDSPQYHLVQCVVIMMA